ncbi:N-acetylneuraminate synthase family protein [Ornithinimicrobium sp. INDO-MA30-4]|uniref:N-acetylneuraminate synthase family protein n=1 Tax=Ornithinimicrobium sp. INDO-MA30-4 TaxID=2908651 RepID=UPI001F45CB76|nr:N-acetylneuraminate synthase family protein [Ornithinimicrobium sp. INDO-MA30-4]UJH69890.1 N-acetylneuraminate synthase family protein [Ornithinimicrobium sp. INDO-MA30-4]
MIIERNLAPYIVYGEDPVLSALEKITANQAHIVFVVSEHGHHLGALSDGDFRRWLSGQDNVDLTAPCREVANTDSLTVASTESAHEIERLFRPGIVHIPMVDEQQHITAIAINRSDQFRIGRYTVSPDHPAVLIAEIGINHQGSVEMAKHLVDLAAEAGADVVKFQLRDMSALYRQSGTATNSGEDLGPQYTLDLLAKYNLSAEQLFEVFDHRKERDIDVICTPWDEPSVTALMDYGIPALKVASADMTNHALLTKMGSYGVPLVLSTGMSTETEIKQTVDVVRDTGAPFAMLHCQSTYPAPYKDVNLAYMQRLGELSQSPVGYSGHERGFHVPVAAVALGAKVIEKHFTTDRSLEGNDHKVSLLPHEFAEMVKRVREIEEAMGSGAPRVVSTGEMMNRVNLAKSLVAKGPIEAGQVISREDIDIKSPGRGLQPNSLQQLIGRTAQRSLASGDFFYASDLSDTVATGRDFTFNRPWGLPVRYHDVETLTENSTPDFLSSTSPIRTWSWTRLRFLATKSCR